MTRDEIDVLLKANEGKFYIYQLSKPDGTPFYIGKGIRRRIFNHEVEANGPGYSHKLNVIRRIKGESLSIDYAILDFYESESDCHAREVAEILRIGRHDLKTGPLTNLTSGGEGVLGLSDEARARIDHDLHSSDAPGERGVANRFYFELCGGVRSVPIRPVAILERLNALPPFASISKRITERQVAALAASAIANGILLRENAIIPRRLHVQGNELIIEYGASKNILQSGAATIHSSSSPKHESFQLTGHGFAAILALLEKSLLVSAGVLMPELE